MLLSQNLKSYIELSRYTVADSVFSFAHHDNISIDKFSID